MIGEKWYSVMLFQRIFLLFQVASLVAMGPINMFTNLLIVHHHELFSDDSDC